MRLVIEATPLDGVDLEGTAKVFYYYLQQWLRAVIILTTMHDRQFDIFYSFGRFWGFNVGLNVDSGGLGCLGSGWRFVGR